ncbi:MULTISPECIES: hypothetical protein [Enterococcus]|uniref:hypothetical protein n=1 Tax=Enterococcus TaxID=1350 RepID=UPI0001B6BAF2|nr:MULTISPECIES: hypothetical protein [Enterococcus]EEV33761.1 conserved hypothetical protein [Enterococcus gallinarum EG2]EOH75934.1 hypothetical protein UAM_03508 [Enterococcus casseliflavus ATCC 49996]EOU02387.1 hypothetical protein I582_03561 [Enterococcus casseliflavus ATCC 49996]MCD5202073.1 hypothetical protein [Enterococcus casseliflavus]MDT2956162.1 hypothetical protein [Enterococcus casseliflavus]
MNRLEFLRDKADNIWYQHTVKTDLGKSFETISNFKELLRKLKAIERDLRLIQKKNSSNREYIKSYFSLLSKRMEICEFLINEFQDRDEVDGVKYDKLIQEMKNRQDEFLAIRRQKMQRR